MTAHGPTPRPRRGARRGTSLLEVMIAAGILVVSLVILVQIQAASVRASLQAEQVSLGTSLAQEKLAEVLLLVEHEGLSSDDIYERGTFESFGEELDVDYGQRLNDYHWEYQVFPVELNLGGDLISEMMSLGEEAQGQPDQPTPGLGALGLSGEALSEQLGRFIREVRVVVWWGVDAKTSEAKGDQVVLVTHIMSEKGAFEAYSGGQVL